MSEEVSAPEIQINVKGPNDLKLQISIATDKTVLELKQAIAGKTEVEAARQRLIYSGRVLKDEDAVSSYKIQSGHTIHMVKGAARTDGSSGSTTSAALPQQLPAMQAGQNPHNPLTQLNSHQGFGAMAGVNPFAAMGLNANDPNMMQNMMNTPEFQQQLQNMYSNPEFVQQMSAMLSNPEVFDQTIGSSPELPPWMRENVRQMVTNPQALQQMLQFSATMQGSGGNPFGGMGAGAGGPAFPAPGVPTNAVGATTASGATPPGATSAAAPNPFGFNPEMMQQMFAAGAGGGFGGATPFGGAPAGGTPGGAPWGGFSAAPAAPADTRPPEERFQVQLQQLNDMGFTIASQNIRALLATGGNVHSAIEYILGGGGL